MFLKKLVLKNFRNIKNLECDFNNRIHFFIGDNGQGKTSILESIGYLSLLRSFRGAKNEDIPMRSQSFASIEGDLTDPKNDLNLKLKVHFSEGSKQAFIHDKPYKSTTAYLTQRFGDMSLGFHSVSFNPSDHAIVKGEPALRRAYIDKAVSAQSLSYLKGITRYQKLVVQRNAALKAEALGYGQADLLDSFTEPLVDLGSELFIERLKWLSEINARLQEVLLRLKQTGFSLECVLLTEMSENRNHFERLSPIHFTGLYPPVSLENVRSLFRSRLKETRQKELRTQTTCVGPHRDDWAFVLKSDGLGMDEVRFLKSFGSQGEIRTALLALKLCELELFRTTTGHRPILLVDDFSSELDQGRREYLLRFLQETDLQVFVTATELPEFSRYSESSAHKVFPVRDGSILTDESGKQFKSPEQLGIFS